MCSRQCGTGPFIPLPFGGVFTSVWTNEGMGMMSKMQLCISNTIPGGPPYLNHQNMLQAIFICWKLTGEPTVNMPAIFVELLSHWCQVTLIWGSELGHHCLRQWFVACSGPSHYLKQSWPFSNWTKISEICFETQLSHSRKSILNVTREMFKPQCINWLWPGDAIWRHGIRSTLAQVTACCLTAQIHYLN